MFDLGFQELIVIFLVALVVFGPKRLPELGRTVGKGIGELKKAMLDMKAEVEKEELQQPENEAGDSGKTEGSQPEGKQSEGKQSDDG